MSMTMEQKIEYAKYLGVKAFSNKRYSIHVMLFDHGMAIARIRYKKRKNQRGLWRWGCNCVYFDECRRESVYDTWDCLYFLQMDKVARRWFRKTLHPCFEKFLLPNGIISSEIAEEFERKERQQCCFYEQPQLKEEEDRVLWWNDKV